MEYVIIGAMFYAGQIIMDAYTEEIGGVKV